MASVPPNCCELCGGYLLHGARTVTLAEEWGVARRYVVCKPCRNVLSAAASAALDKAADKLRAAM